MKKDKFQETSGRSDKTEKSGSTSAVTSIQPRLQGPAPPAPRGFMPHMPVAKSIKPLPTAVKTDPLAGSHFRGDKKDEQ